MYRYIETELSIYLGTVINNPRYWYHSDEKHQREVAPAVKDGHSLEKRKI